MTAKKQNKLEKEFLRDLKFSTNTRKEIEKFIRLITKREVEFYLFNSNSFEIRQRITKKNEKRKEIK